jgi:hypothetical protein
MTQYTRYEHKNNYYFLKLHLNLVLMVEIQYVVCEVCTEILNVFLE